MTEQDQNEEVLQENIQEQYLKSLDSLEEGKIIEGTIVAITENQVFVDVGYKSEGKINIDQFESPPKEGESVQVVLLYKEGRHGEVVISKKLADDRIAWNKVKTAFQDQTPIEGEVSRVIKGGFEISLGGNTRGFNPISKIDVFKNKDPESYLGLKSNFYVDQLYNENRVNIILSRQKWLFEEMDSKRNHFFETTTVGDTVSGIVSAVTSFGAFVNLGGFDGLLHLKDMAWGHVTKPKSFVKVGEKLDLKVIYLDPENNKINLSLKEFQENPWDSFTKYFQLHDVVSGRVTKVAEFGAFVELKTGIEGLVHVSEFSWTKHIRHPQDILKVNDEIKVKILGFDLDEQKISLGIKQLEPNPWDSIEIDFPIGTKTQAKVTRVLNNGAYLELGNGILAFLHIDNISWTRRNVNLNSLLTINEMVDVIVLEFNRENHSIQVGIKQLVENPWKQLSNQYSVGSLITVEIIKKIETGMIARAIGAIEGFIPKLHISQSEENFESILEEYQLGQSIEVSILEIDQSKQKLIFSIRESKKIQEQQELQKYMNSDSNDESTSAIADIINQDTKN